MRVLALLAGLALASGASAAAPVASDWLLLGVAQSADSALVIDKNSVESRGSRKQARVAVVYDASSDIGAIEMTLIVDCATGREKARAVRLHDQSGRVFPQGVSGRFELAETGEPWHRYLCATPASTGSTGQVLAPLGADFPMASARRLLAERAASPAQTVEQVK